MYLCSLHAFICSTVLTCKFGDEQVVSEYRKARAIMADFDADNAPEGVWHNLFQEVDKVSCHLQIVPNVLLSNTDN